jgi:hypothetical protein
MLFIDELKVIRFIKLFSEQSIYIEEFRVQDFSESRDY